MKTGAEKRKRILYQCIIMGIIFLLLLLMHVFFRTDYGDDVIFAEDSKTMGEFLLARYRFWTSRVIIEAGIKLLTACPGWVWRILNILMVLLLVWITADLFGMGCGKTKLQAQIFFFPMLCTLAPFSFCGAGWIATTMNYLWPLTLGLVAMRPIKHWVKGERCPAWEYVVCPVCVLYGANVEQGAAVILGGYLVFGLYLLKERKRLTFFYWVLLFLTVTSIVFILTAPGNAYRLASETEQWFPEFTEMNLLDKLFMGFIDTVNYYAAAGGRGRRNYVFALLTGVLLAGMLQKKSEKGFWLKIWAAVVPFVFYWGIGRFANEWLLTKGFRRGGHIIGLLGMNRHLPGLGEPDWEGIVYSPNMMFLQGGAYLILLICVALTVYFLHGKSKETLLEFVILGGGILSQIIMGFSPTIYVSGERTAIYGSVAILIVCLRNLQICWDRFPRRIYKAVLIIYLAILFWLSVDVWRIVLSILRYR